MSCNYVWKRASTRKHHHNLWRETSGVADEVFWCFLLCQYHSLQHEASTLVEVYFLPDLGGVHRISQFLICCWGGLFKDCYEDTTIFWTLAIRRDPHTSGSIGQDTQKSSTLCSLITWRQLGFYHHGYNCPRCSSAQYHLDLSVVRFSGHLRRTNSCHAQRPLRQSWLHWQYLNAHKFRSL